MRGKSENTEEKIVEAAIVVFGSSDFDIATTDQVAEASGVSKGTVFLHFNKKSDLIEKVALKSVPYDVINNIDLKKFDSVSRLLDAMATSFMEKYRDPNLRSLLIKTLAAKERYPRVKRKLKEACMDRMDDFFSRAEELLGRKIPQPMRRAFFGALLCYVVWWGDNSMNSRDYVRSLVDNFIK